MEKSREENHEKSFVTMNETGEKQLSLDIFLRTLIQRCMGKALDYGRLSGMSDRSMTQFERSIKDEYYNIILNGIHILKEFNLVDKDAK